MMEDPVRITVKIVLAAAQECVHLDLAPALQSEWDSGTVENKSLVSRISPPSCNHDPPCLSNLCISKWGLEEQSSSCCKLRAAGSELERFSNKERFRSQACST